MYQVLPLASTPNYTPQAGLPGPSLGSFDSSRTLLTVSKRFPSTFRNTDRRQRSWQVHPLPVDEHMIQTPTGGAPETSDLIRGQTVIGDTLMECARVSLTSPLPHHHQLAWCVPQKPGCDRHRLGRPIRGQAIAFEL